MTWCFFIENDAFCYGPTRHAVVFLLNGHLTSFTFCDQHLLPWLAVRPIDIIGIIPVRGSHGM